MVSKTLSVCPSVTNFDPNYLKTGETEWARKFQNFLSKSRILVAVLRDWEVLLSLVLSGLDQKKPVSQTLTSYCLFMIFGLVGFTSFWFCIFINKERHAYPFALLEIFWQKNSSLLYVALPQILFKCLSCKSEALKCISKKRSDFVSDMKKINLPFY